MTPFSSPHLGALLDFVVWENDGLYALVTVVALLFAGVLIFVITRQSRSPEREQAARARAAASIARYRKATNAIPGQSDTDDATSPSSEA